MKKFGHITVFETLPEIVAPEHTALVLWDVQNGTIDTIYNRDEFVNRLQILVAAARERNITMVYTKITPVLRDFNSSWRLYTLLHGKNIDDPAKIPPGMLPSSPEAEIHPAVLPREGDIVLNKHTPSIFIGTHFEALMRNRGITTLLFTGIATDIGIDSSARDASNRDFYTIVVEDCCSSPQREMHQLTLKVLKEARYCDRSILCLVHPSGEIIESWRK